MASFVKASRETLVYKPTLGDLLEIKIKSGTFTRITNETLESITYEMDFLNNLVTMGAGTPIIVCVGNAPANHMIKIVELYRFCEFHLYDEMEFSHEIQTFAFTSNDRVKLFDYIPSDEQLKEYSNVQDRVYLISNYTNPEVRVKPDHSKLPFKDQQIAKLEFHMKKEEYVRGDAAKNISIAQVLNPVAALLKFRPPHVHKNDLKRDEFTFFNGEVMLPIFGGPKTSKCRMIVTNYEEIVGWDYELFTRKINTWNDKIREMPALNPFTGNPNPLPNQLGNQMEICILFSIIKDYYITIGHENPSVTDVNNLYINFLIGECDNYAICG